MSFTVLAVIGVAALCGPLLAHLPGSRVPTILGELGVGVLLGPTVLGLVDPADSTLSFLAQVGFALVMFVSGTHVPLRHASLGTGLLRGSLRAGGVALLAVPTAFAIGALTHGEHPWVYALLLASSSAAVVVPSLQKADLDGTPVAQLIAQVAVADVACVVLASLALDHGNAAVAVLGTAVVLLGLLGFWFTLRAAHRSSVWRRVHRLSEREHYALELRLTLVALFALCALAIAVHSSILLAAFGVGLALAAVGSPRRLSRQVFGLTEGFLGPLFFVWLGSSLDLRGLAGQPAWIGLGLLLGAGAVAVHAVMALTGQPIRLAVVSAAQLGLPLAVVTLGQQGGVTTPGEDAAVMLGAVVTLLAVAVVSPGRALGRSRRRRSATDGPDR
jgi:Kef-type K+ transport system membrane component KefB